MIYASIAQAALVFERSIAEVAVDEGGEVRVEFEYRNAGPGAVVIARVEASCGCTTAEPPREPVAEGATGRLEVRYRAGRAQGEQHQTVTVREVGGTTHELKLRVEVRPRVEIEPRLLLFRDGDSAPQAIRLRFGLATPVTITGVEFSAPGFELDRPVESDGVVATIWIRPESKLGVDTRTVARLRTRDALGREHTDGLYVRYRP